MTITYAYEVLQVSVEDHVAHVEINRPKKLNAMNPAFWQEMRECFRSLSVDNDVRAVVISARGRLFTSGLDLKEMMLSFDASDIARKAARLLPHIASLQQSFSAIEECRVPVIAAIHSGCIGGGVDLITACDVRYASSDAWFAIKEVDIGLAADVGTLQRLPKVVGNHSLVREWCYTGRRFDAQEALNAGLVSRLFDSREEVIAGALTLAKTLAAKSPVAILGTKHNLNYSRDHTVADGLEHIAVWNSAMLQTKDLMQAAQASFAKKPAKFAKL
ncbi:delta(3,5)-Delta(2,4)-dienoyl-CoA isomerase [Diplonema papillatum]|nr:delta(3,5)-Delta(2,4)-dienoyl-CoA isomerase [Diplonema papillatum]